MKRLWIVLAISAAALGAAGGPHTDQKAVTAINVNVIKHPDFYPVVDVHRHFRPTAVSYDLAVKVMDRAGIAVTVALTGATGERLDAHFKQAARYPGRFIIFCGVEGGRPWRGEPVPDNIGEIYAAQLQEAYDKGAKGFGEISTWPIREGGLAWDNPRYDPMWSKLEELRMPVNWHVGTPSRYWRTETPYNTLERPRHDKSAPLKFDLLMQQNRVLEKHPNLIVIAAHSNFLADMVPLLEWRMRKFPYYYCDLSATIGEWGRVPEEFRYMATEYSDRFFYGTDTSYSERHIDYYGEGDIDKAAENMAAFHLAHMLFLGTDQRMLPIPFKGNYGRYLVGWRNGYTRYAHDGVDLPREVLEKIYYKNAERLFGIDVENWCPPQMPEWVSEDDE